MGFSAKKNQPPFRPAFSMSFACLAVFVRKHRKNEKKGGEEGKSATTFFCTDSNADTCSSNNDYTNVCSLMCTYESAVLDPNTSARTPHHDSLRLGGEATSAHLVACIHTGQPPVDAAPDGQRGRVGIHDLDACMFFSQRQLGLSGILHQTWRKNSLGR